MSKGGGRGSLSRNINYNTDLVLAGTSRDTGDSGLGRTSRHKGDSGLGRNTKYLALALAHVSWQAQSHGLWLAQTLLSLFW